MVTGRVRAGFFHTRTQPAGQDPWPGPAPFRDWAQFVAQPKKKKKATHLWSLCSTNIYICTQVNTQTPTYIRIIKKKKSLVQWLYFKIKVPLYLI